MSDLTDVAEARSRLRDVYWIGGGSGAGKTTVARRLAARHGMRLYSTDEAMSEHARRSTPRDAPLLSEFAAMDMDERWVNRSPETMLRTFHWFNGEGFALIIDDLLSLPPEPAIIVEGFRLLPRLVAPYLSAPRQSVWLLPAPAFRRAAFTARGSLWEIAGRTTDPQRALHNLLERDRLFTERLRAETGLLRLRAIEIDESTAEDELAEHVRTAFGL